MAISVSKKIISGLVTATFICGLQTSVAQSEEAFKPAFIRSAMLKVADWQFKNPNTKPLNTWTNGAFYTGVFAAYQTTKSATLLDSLMAICERNNWQTGRRYDHADDYAISQTYIDLYRIKKAPQMIQATVDSLKKMAALPGNEIEKHGILWWWCDALFMAPPTLAKLSKTLKDPAYLIWADTLFRQTYNLLYNKDARLFARDASYLTDANGNGKKEENGKNIFWGRGNGWVMGGLVKLLEEMPADYPGRPFYTDLFRQMAGSLLALQHPDGLWRTSLLNPEAYPGGEASGTGFICYALAWGVNQKLLDKTTFSPAARKAWIALNALCSPEGRVGWVQPIGADPKRNFNADSWETYGAGAFLLAASEMIKLKK